MIINLSTNSSKSYTTVVLSEEDEAFLFFLSIVFFCLYTTLYNQRISLKFLVFHATGDIMEKEIDSLLKKN